MPVARRLACAAAALALLVALLFAVLRIYFSAAIVRLPPNREAPSERLTQRIVLFCIDGLRYDTALETGWMPNLIGLGKSGVAGVSLTSPVTMTNLGVRAIGTGVSPGLRELILNFNLTAVDFDNPLAALAARGGRIALVGDRSWMDLFGPSIAIDVTPPDGVQKTPMFSDAVYGDDAVWVPRAVDLMARNDWDLAIIHLGGIDHASHQWTPWSDRFRQKAQSVDEDIARIVRAAGPQTTIIITSDHGAGNRGHHGSGEPEARRTPLVLAGPAIAQGVRLSVRQIDIAPTLAVLFGLPLPAPSEGRVLTEALALDPAARAKITAANARQLERYANAYAAAHGVSAPAVETSAEKLEAVAQWKEAISSRASVQVLLWALALTLAAIALLLDGGNAAAWAGVLVIALGSLVAENSGGLLASLAIVVGGVATVPSLLLLRLRGRLLLAGVAILATVEIGLGIARLHSYDATLALHRFAIRMHSSSSFVLAAATALVAAVVFFLLRRWRPTIAPGVMMLGVVAVSAFGDSLALHAGIAAALLLVALWGASRERWQVLAAAIAGAIASYLVDTPWSNHLRLAPIAPLILLGCAWTSLAGARRSTLIALAVLTLGVSVCAVTGNAVAPYRGVVALGALVALGSFVTEADQHAWSALGWSCAILLSLLCQDHQLPGLLAWTVVAAFAGRLSTLREPGLRASLLAGMLVVAVRLGFFGLFEGAFQFSRLEIWLGYRGNPGLDHGFGALVIALKYSLPFVLAIGLVTAQMRRDERTTALAVVGAFLLLRTAHIALSMTLARGTFFAPYSDAGHLLFTVAMAISLAGVVGLMATLRLLPTAVVEAVAMVGRKTGASRL